MPKLAPSAQIVDDQTKEAYTELVDIGPELMLILMSSKSFLPEPPGVVIFRFIRCRHDMVPAIAAGCIGECRPC